MCGPVFKLTNMTMNLLPYVLVIWGFYTMVRGINIASATTTFETFVNSETCGLETCTNFSFDDQFKVINGVKAEKDYKEHGLPFFGTFTFVNLIWMVLYVRGSGFFSESWGTVGYHAQNVKAMRQPTYTYFGYFICFILVIMTLYGVSMLSDEPKLLQVLFNGIFQCALGLMALMSPVPDTIQYGEKVKNCKISAKPWQTSRAVMEIFQDAVAAASSGDSRYLRDLTGCGKSEVAGLLADVTAIPFEAGCLGRMCGKGDEEDAPNPKEGEDGTDAVLV